MNDAGVRAVVVPVDGPAQVVFLRDDDESEVIYDLIGGTDHDVLYAAGAGVVYDFEARSELDNMAVVRAFAKLGDPLPVVPPGAVLVIGKTTGRGEWTDCPPDVCAALVG